ncbi:Phosphoserine phosphatase RsbU [Planctomycetes bacterium Poly30]|uniref:Phosphoserine phosphatase RsbU n=1 Tax=Saltatorellus ferox TaxID=2528018 RepID=A0A518F069_9BACT|nr:Phosphoserine phosphatase RsbU [Planctomycetes bacterium Poly30]
MASPREGRARSSGLGIAPRFAIATTAVLALVLMLFSFVLLSTTREIVTEAVKDSRDQAAIAQAQYVDGTLTYKQVGKQAAQLKSGALLRAEAELSREGQATANGFAYVRGDDTKAHVLVAPAANASGDPVAKLYGLFFAVTALALLITAVVALITATRVSRPITALVDDVRSISNGNLSHRVRAQGGGEVGLLAGAIDRMTESLRDARDTEVELSVREREREVAMEVQEALQPTDFEVPEGYSVASEHVGSSEPGGDFHDIVKADDGRTVFFACDVSGAGVPGALVGAMARAYLKSELKRGGSLESALKTVNRTIAGEVRRGMYVTVLAAALDSDTHELEVASAGHKLPLVHWAHKDKSIRAIQPDGIALGFDKGPVFERGISVRHVPMDEGDRVVIAGTGAVRVINMDGEEIGEKRFYKLFARNAADAPAEALDGVLTALEAFADEEPFPTDVSLIVLGRDA